MIIFWLQATKRVGESQAKPIFAVARGLNLSYFGDVPGYYLKEILLPCAAVVMMTVNAMSKSQATPLPDFDSLWDYDNPADTEARFRELIPGSAGPDNVAYHAELLTQIARTLGLQQKFDSAHELLDTVQAMLLKAGNRAHVRYLLERGRVFNSSNKQSDATPLFLEASQLASDNGLDFLAVDALHMLGIAAPAEERMAWNLRAVALAEKSKDPKAYNWLGSLYNNIGWTWFDQKQYDSALLVFEKGLAFRIKQGKSVPIRIARWSIAKSLRMLQKTGSALIMQRDLLAEWEASGDEMDGYVYEELAECLLELKETAEATKYFALAYGLLSKDEWLSRDEPERLARLKRLGQAK